MAKDPLALRFAARFLKDDRSLAERAIRANGHAFKFVSSRLKNDHNLVLEAVKQEGSLFAYASDQLKENREIVLAAVKQNARALLSAGGEFKGDRELVLEAVKNDSSVFVELNQYVGDREIVLEAVNQDGEALQYASGELKNGGFKAYVLELLAAHRGLVCFLTGSPVRREAPIAAATGRGANQRLRPDDTAEGGCRLPLLNAHGPDHATIIKRTIADYLGAPYPYGTKWQTVRGAAQNLKIKLK